MLTTEVAARLERNLKLGAFPLVRRRMYQRLQRLAHQYGEPVLQIISQVEMEAMGPKIRDAGQYFCWVVKRRLGELGFPLDGPSPNETAADRQATISRLRDRVAGVEAVRASETDEQVYNRVAQQRHEELHKKLAQQEVADRSAQRERLRLRAQERDLRAPDDGGAW